MANKYILPDASMLPALTTSTGEEIPFAQLIAIDPNNLMAEYEVHAAWQATISYAFAKANNELAIRKRLLKRTQAALFFAYKQQFEKEGIKATNDAISNAITSDQAIQDLEDEVGELEHKAEVLSGALRAYHDRKDMLVNLGAHDRAGIPKVLQHADA
jgi:hypothetical protein